MFEADQLLLIIVFRSENVRHKGLIAMSPGSNSDAGLYHLSELDVCHVSISKKDTHKKINNSSTSSSDALWLNI